MICPFCKSTLNNQINELNYFQFCCQKCRFHIGKKIDRSFYSIFIDEYYLFGRSEGSINETTLYSKSNYYYKIIIKLHKYIAPLDYFNQFDYISIKEKLLLLNLLS